MAYMSQPVVEVGPSWDVLGKSGDRKNHQHRGLLKKTSQMGTSSWE